MEPENAPHSKLRQAGVGGWVSRNISVNNNNNNNSILYQCTVGCGHGYLLTEHINCMKFVVSNLTFEWMNEKKKKKKHTGNSFLF